METRLALSASAALFGVSGLGMLFAPDDRWMLATLLPHLASLDLGSDGRAMFFSTDVLQHGIAEGMKW